MGYDGDYTSDYERVYSVNKKRMATPCFFKDGLSKQEFENIAKSVAKKNKRIKSVTIQGAIIYCIAESKTGFSTWGFSVDFNDWGHVTGIYWTKTDNDQSTLPRYYAQMVSQSIHDYLSKNGISLEDYSYFVDLNKDLETPQGLEYHEKQGIISNIIRQGAAFAFVGNDSKELLNNHLYPVISKIKSFGFKNINTVPILDINNQCNKFLFEVEQIIIGGTGYFERGDAFADNAEVIITYHLKQRIPMPFSESDFKKTNHLMVNNRLFDLGYRNIKERKIEDLITGWIKKDGTVERVLVNEGCEVPIVEGRLYQYDVEIIIVYHTFKR